MLPHVFAHLRGIFVAISVLVNHIPGRSQGYCWMEVKIEKIQQTISIKSMQKSRPKQFPKRDFPCILARNIRTIDLRFILALWSESIKLWLLIAVYICSPIIFGHMLCFFLYLVILRILKPMSVKNRVGDSDSYRYRYKVEEEPIHDTSAVLYELAVMPLYIFICVLPLSHILSYFQYSIHSAKL